jgi:ribonucleoside-triphosphate reductase
MEIDKDLTETREQLAHIEGAPAEVYSRIVGYYRSVRNWNKGKKEEYDERKLFDISRGWNWEALRKNCEENVQYAPARQEGAEPIRLSAEDSRLLLFVRPACPACPSAKAAAGKLGIPVDTVNADTEAGLEEAVRRNVFSTPTAILLAKDGKEISRALDSAGIAALEDLIAV